METVLGYVTVGMGFVMCLLLILLGTVVARYLQYKSKAQSQIRRNVRLISTIMAKEMRNVQLKGELKTAKDSFDALQKENDVMSEYLQSYIDTCHSQEELIATKDEELNYLEEYVRNSEHTLKIQQERIDSMEEALKAEKAEGKEHLKSCLLNKIHDVANLQKLNDLLKNANESYAKDLDAAWEENDRLKSVMAESGITEVMTISMPRKLKHNVNENEAAVSC
jgi:chromosome segregation ATPase